MIKHPCFLFMTCTFFIHRNLIRVSFRVTYRSWSVCVSHTSTAVCEGLLPLALEEGRIALVMSPKSGYLRTSREDAHGGTTGAGCHGLYPTQSPWSSASGPLQPLHPLKERLGAMGRLPDRTESKRVPRPTSHLPRDLGLGRLMFLSSPNRSFRPPPPAHLKMQS